MPKPLARTKQQNLTNPAAAMCVGNAPTKKSKGPVRALIPLHANVLPARVLPEHGGREIKFAVRPREVFERRDRILMKPVKKPKKPKTAYNYFQLAEKERISVSTHNERIARNIGQKWKRMSLAEKMPYKNLAKMDKMRYERQNKLYLQWLARGSAARYNVNFEHTFPQPTTTFPGQYTNNSTTAYSTQFTPMWTAVPQQQNSYQYVPSLVDLSPPSSPNTSRTSSPCPPTAVAPPPVTPDFVLDSRVPAPTQQPQMNWQAYGFGPKQSNIPESITVKAPVRAITVKSEVTPKPIEAKKQLQPQQTEFDVGSFLKDDEPMAEASSSSTNDIFSGLTSFLDSNLDTDLFDFPIDTFE
uniref:HMG box domain-containing protein n=1 Tax=Lotharella globosa TaxID=91324 RepID=A0A7S4DVZ4_9EUKA